MNISGKIGTAITATMLLALNVSSSPATAGLFTCEENQRGIGEVSATSTRNSVTLFWSVPNSYAFRSIDVCYKKSWSLDGKCEGGMRASKNYGTFVSQGDITIPNLDKNSCYKFAVYGYNDVPGPLIGMKKIKTTK